MQATRLYTYEHTCKHSFLEVNTFSVLLIMHRSVNVAAQQFDMVSRHITHYVWCIAGSLQVFESLIVNSLLSLTPNHAQTKEKILLALLSVLTNLC